MPKVVEAILNLLYLGLGISKYDLNFIPTPGTVSYACGRAFEPRYFKERFLTPQNYK